jgi:hypothetical protein
MLLRHSQHYSHFFKLFDISVAYKEHPPHSLDGFPSKVMFFPGKTSHTRLFPKKHTFSYSYLLVGIPVGWKGSVGGMLAVDYEKKLAPWYLRWLSLSAGNTWYSVNGDDYLARGHVEGRLKEKLENYLSEQVRPLKFALFKVILITTRASISNITPMPTSSQSPASAATSTIPSRYGISAPQPNNSLP